MVSLVVEKARIFTYENSTRGDFSVRRCGYFAGSADADWTGPPERGDWSWESRAVVRYRRGTRFPSPFECRWLERRSRRRQIGRAGHWHELLGFGEQDVLAK